MYEYVRYSYVGVFCCHVEVLLYVNAQAEILLFLFTRAAHTRAVVARAASYTVHTTSRRVGKHEKDISAVRSNFSTKIMFCELRVIFPRLCFVGLVYSGYGYGSVT